MEKVISDEELAEFLRDILFNLNQWTWNFCLTKAARKYGPEGKKYIESLSEKEVIEMPRKPLHVSIRKMDIFDRHRAFGAMREAGISPLDVVYETHQRIKREEKIECALLEAGVMIGREYELSAILDYVEGKYSKAVGDICEIVGEYLTRLTEEGRNFGLIMPFEKAEREWIGKAIFGEKYVAKEESDAPGS